MFVVWKRMEFLEGEFEVCDAAGERETEAGIVRGPFGIFSLGGEGRSASWSYLIHIPSGQTLALFSDEALAMSAANVLSRSATGLPTSRLTMGPASRRWSAPGSTRPGKATGRTKFGNAWRRGRHEREGGHRPPFDFRKSLGF